ncbi:ATP-binding protein [Bradyrhizobium septentrionale]|uniref:ATP-binding protein n=1 Tax=Bradyrhizobium septentrionale TaxID=1404411 RepID=UPI001596BBF8|nr:ATP-binding protein [Bradyrhizobium septentrionale]UGY25456.1 ATP-binding protein [Bradyrhizobium septentrionale]
MASHSLVDPDRYLGTVSVVTATMVQANMPFARAQPEKRALARGAVGDFVFIDCEMIKLLGRIIEVAIPESERLTIEPSLGKASETHPVGKILVFASVDYRQSKLVRGLRTHPRVGDSVYLADPARFGELIASALSTDDRLSLELGTLDAGASVPLRLLPEQLFGRHCGIFGATGGGKSWTLATVLSQIKSAGGKAILFDPTGEFAGLPSIAKHYAFDANEPGTIQVHFPYRQTTEEDLFALFRPSGQTQGPKLREAIRSLKLIKILGGASPPLNIFENRLLVKRQKPRKPWIVALNQHKLALHSPYCDFAIEDLQEQLQAECVYNTDRDNTSNWGGIDPQATSYCEGLNTRIGTLVYSNELACLFGTVGPSLADILTNFIASEDDDIIRVSFKNVRFEHNTREVLINVIGRFLLGLARTDRFRDQPLIVILDEAHQFLGRIVGDEYASVKLDSFGLIAKEGRKYGLTCVMATQRPRDVPAEVLSQLGTLIVHRLTNDEDRQAVERACGDLDRNAALFIPTLSPGEAIIIGPGLPAPVPITVSEPAVPPNSRGPDYEKYWRGRRAPSD